MRIRTAGVISALTVVLLGSGCTIGDDDPTSAVSAPSGGTLTIWADGVQAAALAPFTARYGKQHHVAVTVRAVAGDRQQQFVAAVRSAAAPGTPGGPPDIVLGGSDWIGNLVQHATIEAVPLSAAQKASFAEIAIKAVTFHGQVYGVPYAVENVALIRNTDLVPVPPVTIEEAAAIGRQLQVAGKSTQPVGYPVGQTGDFRSVYPLFTSAGGVVFGVTPGGEYNTDAPDVGEPASVAAFARIATLGEQGSGALVRAVSSDNATALFTTGKTVYLVAGYEAIAAIKKAGLPYDISPVPPFANAKPAQPLVGAQAFFVASTSRNKAVAHDFVANYVTRTDVAAALYQAQPSPPALTAVVDQIRPTDPDAQKFLDVARGGAVLPAIPQMGVVWNALNQAEATVIAGADVPSAVSAAAASIDTALR